MKPVRKILLKVLGLTGYYSLVSRIYIFLVANGLVKKKYPEIFYLREMIKPGFYCIDIGANMGYYSYFLSKYSGHQGKVFAVEPVPLFAEILKKNISTSGYNNVELLPFALGEKNQQVKMGTPVVDGIIHHGMTRITTTERPDFVQYYDAEMRVPDELFKDLQRLDFIKCDVEGYEHYVFGNMLNLIQKFKPIIQTELSNPEGREKVKQMLNDIGYHCFLLNQKDQLVPLEEAIGENYSTDYYFINK